MVVLKHSSVKKASKLGSNTQLHIATDCNSLYRYAANSNKSTATYWSIMHHTATHCPTPHHTATHCITLQHTAAHYKTLQQLMQIHCLFQQVDCNTFVHVCRKYRFNTLEVCPSLLQSLAVCSDKTCLAARLVGIRQCVAVCSLQEWKLCKDLDSTLL